MNSGLTFGLCIFEVGIWAHAEWLPFISLNHSFITKQAENIL